MLRTQGLKKTRKYEICVLAVTRKEIYIVAGKRGSCTTRIDSFDTRLAVAQN